MTAVLSRPSVALVLPACTAWLRLTLLQLPPAMLWFTDQSSLWPVSPSAVNNRLDESCDCRAWPVSAVNPQKPSFLYSCLHFSMTRLQTGYFRVRHPAVLPLLQVFRPSRCYHHRFPCLFGEICSFERRLQWLSERCFGGLGALGTAFAVTQLVVCPLTLLISFLVSLALAYVVLLVSKVDLCSFPLVSCLTVSPYRPTLSFLLRGPVWTVSTGSSNRSKWSFCPSGTYWAVRAPLRNLLRPLDRYVSPLRQTTSSDAYPFSFIAALAGKWRSTSH